MADQNGASEKPEREARRSEFENHAYLIEFHQSTVDDVAFEACVVDACREVDAPLAGLFGPESVSWRVNRESIVFLGAARAALMQVAHPFVAQAIAEQSTTLSDPIGRFHRTFQMMFSMIFGSRDQAVAQARLLRQVHARITGCLPEPVGMFSAGTVYRADQKAPMMWVLATLIDSAVRMYDAVCPALSAAEREIYYSESLRVAALFGLARDEMPESWAAFEDYMSDVLCSDVLACGTAGHTVGQFLIHGRQADGRRTFVPLPPFYRAVTARFLPARLRDMFGLGFDEAEARRSDHAIARLRRYYPKLPDHVRYVPPYFEAMARLQGRRDAGMIVKLFNRIWVGRPRLVS